MASISPLRSAYGPGQEWGWCIEHPFQATGKMYDDLNEAIDAKNKAYEQALELQKRNKDGNKAVKVEYCETWGLACTLPMTGESRLSHVTEPLCGDYWLLLLRRRNTTRGLYILGQRMHQDLFMLKPGPCSHLFVFQFQQCR